MKPDSLPAPVMNDDELRTYVAQHENDYVQQYVAALLEERAELADQLDTILRRGYSDDGRSAMQKVQRVLIAVAVGGVTVVAFVLGRLSG